jgi:hypothetical protein
VLAVAMSASAQRPDTLAVSDTLVRVPAAADSLLPVQKEGRFVHILHRGNRVLVKTGRGINHFFTNNYPDPPKAALFSIIPGGGQIYNKRFWKVPVVWGVLGGLGVWQYKTTGIYKDLSTAYREKVNDRPVFNTRYASFSAPTLLSYRDQYRRYTETLWLGICLTYALSAAEAYVDAHLRNFDVDDNLTFRPVIAPAPGAVPAFGLGVRVSLGR